MKLILTQPEIEQILRNHINETVTLATGSDFKIDFVATRSDDGVTATIDIPYMGVSSIPAIAEAAAASKPAEKPAPRTRTRAAASAPTPVTPEPVVEHNDADAASSDADDAPPFVTEDTETCLDESPVNDAAEPEVEVAAAGDATAEVEVEAAAPRRSLFTQ